VESSYTRATHEDNTQCAPLQLDNGKFLLLHPGRAGTQKKRLGMECYTCKSISGEKRISPGPTLYDGKFWLVEAEHFHHIHFRLVPKPRDLPDELKASKVFAMLKVEKEEAVPPDEIRALCEHLKARFEQAAQ
jgi:hypothetical protein